MPFFPTNSEMAVQWKFLLIFEFLCFCVSINTFDLWFFLNITGHSVLTWAARPKILPAGNKERGKRKRVKIIVMTGVPNTPGWRHLSWTPPCISSMKGRMAALRMLRYLTRQGSALPSPTRESADLYMFLDFNYWTFWLQKILNMTPSCILMALTLYYMNHGPSVY